MTILTYNLTELTQRVMAEFGIVDDAEQKTFIEQKINEAQLFICRSRKNWDWQQKEHVIDVPDKTSVTLSVANGSAEAVLVSGTVEAGKILVPSPGSGGALGFTIKSFTGGVVLLDRQWDGATGTVELSLMAGYLPLPEDFIKIITSHQVANLHGDVFKFYDIQRFMQIRNEANIGVGFTHIYTILGDPTGQSVSARYMGVFPYLETQTSIHFTYSRIPPLLVEGSDEPIIPLMDRPVLLYGAMWLVAVAKGYDKALVYRNQMLDELNRMAEHADEDETIEFYDDYSHALDMSMTRGFDFPFDPDYQPPIV